MMATETISIGGYHDLRQLRAELERAGGLTEPQARAMATRLEARIRAAEATAKREAAPARPVRPRAVPAPPRPPSTGQSASPYLLTLSLLIGGPGTVSG